MNAERKPTEDTPDKGYMKRPLVASALFHAFLVMLFSGAFFVFSRPIEIPPEAMSIEILPVEDKAQSDKAAPIAPKPKDEPKEVADEPPPLPKSEPKPTPPKSVAEAPKPPQPTKPEPKPEATKPEPKPEPIKKAEAPAKKPEPKPEPKTKPETKPEPKPEPEPQDSADFSSVLKNLVGEEAPPTPESQPRDTDRQAPQLTAPAPLGARLSMSEMDGLRAQLGRCWRVLPGARDAATLVVQISITVSPNKIVQDARVVDQLRYSSDPFFRAAADSALSALRSPNCTPLDVPDGKYDQWKSMTINFDPKEMF